MDNYQWANRDAILSNASEFAKQHETPGGVGYPRVFADPKGIATVGHGYALGVRDKNEVDRDFRAAGIEPYSDQDWAYIQNGHFDKVSKELKPTEMERLHMDKIVKSSDFVADHLDSLGKKPSNFTDAEVEAMIDLHFRGGENLIGSGSVNLNRAIRDGDSEAILYEIEERSNGDNLPGNDVRMHKLGAEIRKERGLPSRVPQGEVSPTNIAPGDSSILDGVGDAIGAAGSAIATVGSVAFDAAMSVGKDSLIHMATQAAAQGGMNGKAALAGTAKIAMAQTLGRMHSLVMQEVEKHQGHPFRTPGIAGPIPEPDGTTRDAIEKTINDPRNAGLFDDVANRVGRILQQVENADPGAVLVSKVMDVLRGGNIKVQPQILVPELIPQPEGPQRQPQDDERMVEVAGVPIPIKLPEVRVIMDESGTINIPRRTPDFNPNASSGLHRGADGTIQVKGYTRADGTQVAAHSRSAPDGIVSNNFSYQRKG